MRRKANNRNRLLGNPNNQAIRDELGNNNYHYVQRTKR